MRSISLAAALRSGNPQLGLAIAYPAPGVVERIGHEWDWIWIDGQHGELDDGDILALVRACDLVARPALVRVPGHDFGMIGKALDTGAAGVIIPCVDTPEQARAVAAAAKFPPLGHRSYGGRRPIDLTGRTYSDDANEKLLCVVQIESPEAILNADAIAATPGVDALFLGPDDMMLRRGYDMNEPRNRQTLGDDMRIVADACHAHGKHAAIVAIGAEMLALCLEMEYRLLVGGSDVMFLAMGSKSTAGAARAQFAERTASPLPSDCSSPSSGSAYG